MIDNKSNQPQQIDTTSSYQQPQYQEPHGYSYVPYTDDGPYAKQLENMGKVAGAAVGYDVAGVVGAIIGDMVGGQLGKTAGFYIDNFSAMEQNLGTLIDQLNDPRTWTMPQPND
jgi:hypothetical protein